MPSLNRADLTQKDLYFPQVNFYFLRSTGQSGFLYSGHRGTVASRAMDQPSHKTCLRARIGMTNMIGIRMLLNRSIAVSVAMALAMAALTPISALASDERNVKPVWRSWNARTHEDKQSEYLLYISKIYNEEMKAWKKAGLLTDYKVLIREPRGPDDPDITLMFQYSDLAALDRPSELWAEASRKALEKFKDDPEAQKMMANSDSLRTFIGWSPVARELLLDK